MGLKLSISNIAWDGKDDEKLYMHLQSIGYNGIEIAPSRLFGSNPYEDLEMVKKFKKDILNDYDLNVCSIQSIWFGRNERMFSSDEERIILQGYTEKAILFAEAIGAKNLVFGCPKNRNINKDEDYDVGVRFFKKLGDYAYKHNTVLSIEANPIIYGTNYINYTEDAVELVKLVDSKGFKLNLDVGTIIENKENLECIKRNVEMINHVHISEPYLNPIEDRETHRDLIRILKEGKYDRYVSIEMKKQDNIEMVYKTIDYLNCLIREL